METTTFSFNETINCAADNVYDAFTNAGLLRHWLCTNSQTSIHEGGRVYLYWQQGYTASGEFKNLEPGKKIAMSWQGRHEPFVTQVEIILKESNGNTAVTLTHSDIPTAPEWEPLRTELSKGWETSLVNLKSILETGLDRRIYDQPFLGIIIGGVLNAEQAKEQSLPINGGILINGTAPNTGAEAAGLQNGDVLVNMGGTETADFNGLQAALRPFKPGEKVKITYYREGEKKSEQMTLSHRSQPDLPNSAEETTNALHAAYAALQDDLNNALQGVTEEVANYRPAEDEWNIKEVLTHLIYTERFNQSNLIAQLSNNVLDGFPSHPPAWIKSMLAAYPTLSSMVEAWQNSAKETLALIHHLPSSYVEQKVYYLNMMNTIVNFLPGHTQSHIEQIKNLIQAAQKESL